MLIEVEYLEVQQKSLDTQKQQLEILQTILKHQETGAVHRDSSQETLKDDTEQTVREKDFMAAAEKRVSKPGSIADGSEEKTILNIYHFWTTQGYKISEIHTLPDAVFYGLYMIHCDQRIREFEWEQMAVANAIGMTFGDAKMITLETLNHKDSKDDKDTDKGKETRKIYGFRKKEQVIEEDRTVETIYPPEGYSYSGTTICMECDNFTMKQMYCGCGSVIVKTGKPDEIDFVEGTTTYKEKYEHCSMLNKGSCPLFMEKDVEFIE